MPRYRRSVYIWFYLDLTSLSVLSWGSFPGAIRGVCCDSGVRDRVGFLIWTVFPSHPRSTRIPERSSEATVLIECLIFYLRQRLYKFIFPRKKPVIMFGFLGAWQFSSKAVIWLCDGVLCLARPV